MLTGLLIGWPFLSALFVYLFKGDDAKKVAFGASLLQLVFTIYILTQFQYTDKLQLEMQLPWIASMGINFHVAIDGISVILVLLTNLLVPFIILSSFSSKYENPRAFYALILIMQTALIGVFTSLDGFLFYVFWELALLPIYFICLLWGGENRGKITFKFFVYTLFGSLFMLVALIYLYLQTPDAHSFDLKALVAAGQALPLEKQSIVFWGLFIAFAIKMPVFPFHTWQPDTYTVAPTQGTMLLSGIMLKMGIFGVIRWLLPVVPQGVAEWGMVAVTLSVFGILYASIIAIMQSDIKRLIAYSSIAHVGLISAGLFSNNIQALQGVIIQMLVHGINVFALFFIIDRIEARTNTRNLNELGGIRSVAPVFATVFMIIMLGSVALPFTNGFVGEYLLINGLFQYNSVMAAVAGISIILGAVYMLRAYQKSMLGETNSVTASFAEITLNEKLVLFPIVILVIAIGIFPKPLLALSEPAAQSLLNFINEVNLVIK